MKTLICILLLTIIGCSTTPTKQGVTFVPHELPVYYSGEQLNKVCPACGVCLPKGGNYASVTLMGCGEAGCCNTATYTYQCQVKDIIFC